MNCNTTHYRANSSSVPGDPTFNVILAVSLQLINGFSGQFSLGHAGFMAVGAYMAAYPAKMYSQRFANPAGELLFYLALGIVTSVAGAVLYGLFSLIRLSRKLYSSLPALLMIAVFIWLILDVWAASGYPEAPAWLVWSKSFELIGKLFNSIIESGLPMAVKLSTVIPEAIRPPVSFLILVIGSASCAAAAGFVVGLPALRLRGDYLAIATLGMAEIIRIIIQNSTPLGGALGLTGIPHYTDFTWLYGFAVVTTFVIWRIAYSSQGRTIIAVREDEIAASAIGISTTGRKVVAFVIGAFFGGAAGALFALFDRSINPGYFNMAKSIEIVVMVTLGGLGSISGAILAAIVLTMLPEVLRPIAEYRMVIYSLSLVVMMLLRPQGLLGGKELWPKRLFSRRKAVTVS